MNQIAGYIGVISGIAIVFIFTLSLWDWLGDKKFQQLVILVAAVGIATVLSLIIWTQRPNLIVLPLAVAYLGVGFLIQRNTFRVRVSDSSTAKDYTNYAYGPHRRRVPDPTVSQWKRLGAMFFWGVPFLGVVLWFLGETGFQFGRVVYRVAMGDSHPTEEPPSRELLDVSPKVRERRSVRRVKSISLVFGLLAVSEVVFWTFWKRPSSDGLPLFELIAVVAGVYLVGGLATQWHIHRIKVGPRNGVIRRRRVPDPAVSFRERLATLLFWGVFVPEDLWEFWLKIYEELKKGYRWILGDTQPTLTTPPKEVLFPEEQVVRTVDQIPVEEDLRVLQNGHQGAATQATLEQTEELVGAGSSNKN